MIGHPGPIHPGPIHPGDVTKSPAFSLYFH